MRTAFGREPAWVREGGSIGAVVTMQKYLKAPIVFLGPQPAGTRLHAPNENFDWETGFRRNENVCALFRSAECRVNITVSRRISASPDKIYNIVADYRQNHPRILPKQFQSLVVEEGGFGAGTVIRCKMRVYGRTQSFRATVSEPQPGRLVESNSDGVDSVTTFSFEPVSSNETNVTISTELKTRKGFSGGLKGTFTTFLYPIC